MCDEMHPAQDTSAWLMLPESSESQLYRGVIHLRIYLPIYQKGIKTDYACTTESFAPYDTKCL